MSQLLHDSTFERDACDYFPTPLADTLDEAISESSSRAQRDKVVETFRVAVRLLGLLALGGLRGGAPPAASGQLGDLLKKLLRQGLTEGEWVGLARELARADAASPSAATLPPLVSAFFENPKKVRGVFQQQGACDALLAMRKSDTVAHGVTGTEDSAADVLAARLPDFEQFLKSLEWLFDVKLVVALESAARPDGSVEYSGIYLRGVTPRRGFRTEPLKVKGELQIGRVYAAHGERRGIELYPYIQYVPSSSGGNEVFLFEEMGKHEAVLRTYPTGEQRPDPEAAQWVRSSLGREGDSSAVAQRGPRVGWTIEDLRARARRASDDYLDRMQRERVYLPHLYTRRFELEAHLAGYLNPACDKSGILIVGASGIGKTNTLCHIVKNWRDDPDRLGRDVVLLLGGSTLPGGTFSVRDIILDRLETTESAADFMGAFEAQRKQSPAQLVIVVDSVDKHPQAAELLRQLDDLIVRNEALSWFKVVVSVGEVAWAAIRKSGFIPAVRDYYSVLVAHGGQNQESTEVVVGRLTDEEVADAYERYRQEPGLAPKSAFGDLTEEVKNTLRNPLFLRIVMETFNGRTVPRRVLTAEVLLEYCTKKVFSEPTRAYLVNRIVDILLANRATAASFDTLAREAELREMLLDTSPRSPYLQLLDEQVLEEQLKRVSAVLPPQRTVAFTYDRLLEYLLLNRIAENMGLTPATVEHLSGLAETYLPLQEVLVTILLARVDEGAIDEVAAMLGSGNPTVMKRVGVRLLLELEHRAPAVGALTDAELAVGTAARLVERLAASAGGMTTDLLLAYSTELQKLGLFPRAHFVFECLSKTVPSTDPEHWIAVQRGRAETGNLLGQKQEALEICTEVVRIARETGNQAAEEGLLDLLGRIHLDLGNLGKAREYLEASLAIDRERVKTGSSEALKGEAESLRNLAKYFEDVGEIDRAVEYAQAAREILEKLGDQRELADILRLLGWYARRRGFVGEAMRYQTRAAAMNAQLGDRRGIARCAANLGVSHGYIGQLDEAIRHCERALHLYEEIGEKKGFAVSLVSKGEALRWAGKPAEAIDLYRQAMRIYESLGSRNGIAMCLTNIGAAQLLLGNGEEARTLLGQAADIKKDILGGGDQGEPETLAYLCAAALLCGRTDEALATSDSAREIMGHQSFSEEDVFLVHFFRSCVLHATSRDAEARESLRIAREELERQAATLDDAPARALFLEKLPLRRLLMTAAASGAPAPSWPS